MKKRLVSLLAAAALLVTSIPTPALALEEEVPAVSSEVLTQPAAGTVDGSAEEETVNLPGENDSTDKTESKEETNPETDSDSAGEAESDGETNSDSADKTVNGEETAPEAGSDSVGSPESEGNTGAVEETDPVAGPAAAAINATAEQEGPALLAAGTVDSADVLKAAVEAAVDGEETTVILGADIQLSEPLTVPDGKNIVMNLNGFTLSTSATGTNTGNVINNNGTLTIKNGTVAAADKGSSTAGMAVENLAGATLTVDQDAGATTKLIGRSGVLNYGSVTVLAGTVESYNRNAYWGAAGSTLLVEDGTFTSPTGSSGYGRAISTEGDVTIHGGNFYSGGSSGAGDNYMNAIGMFNGSKLLIEPAEGKTVTVTSKTDYAVSTMGNAKVEIRGGDFTCEGSRNEIHDFESGNVTITGGTFYHEPYAEYLGENCVVVSENDRFTVKKAENPSAVTVNTYEELAAALNGDLLQPKNIALGADVQIPADATLTLQKGYTLDVPAGKTLVLDGILSLEGTMTNEGTLAVENDGFLEYPLQLTNTGTISGLPAVENGVCRVSTPMQLQWLAAMVEWDNNNISARIELANDITMPAVDFTPIGNSEDAFYYGSTFDGCGHSVNGLRVVVTSQYKGGFFGHIGDVTVQNLTVNGTSTNSTSSYIGAVAGYAAGDVTFRNVHVRNYTVNSPISYGVGGFVGQISGQTDDRFEFINCSLENTSVTGYANVGAFWGTSTGSKGSIGIYNCAVSGSVNTINVNGGICGGYGSSAKVQVIGLDSGNLTLTVKGQPSDKLIAYTEVTNDLEYAGPEHTAIKNENGEWVAADAEGVGEAVASVDGISYTSLTAALASLQDGQTVTILASTDVSLTDTYTLAAKNVALDLNGQTVTLNSAAKDVIKLTGSLTIRDGSEGANGVLDIHYTGSTSSGSGISVASGASLNVESGTVSYNTAAKSGRAIYTSGTAAFTMSGGKVKISDAAGYALYLAGSKLHKITGGELVFDQNTTASTVYGIYAISFASTCEGIEIEGLTIDGSAVPEDKKVVCVYGYNNTTPVTISGGEYKANANKNSYAVGAGSTNKTAISGGTFTGPVKAATGKVTGGAFSVQPSALYLPEGKVYQKQADGYYHVVDGSYVAIMNNVGYTSWDELFADASTGSTASTVYITSDAEVITVPAGKNVKLWNSKKATVGKIVNNGTCQISVYAMPGVQVENNGTFYLDQEVGSVVNNAGATMTAGNASSKVTGTVTNHGTMNISQGQYLGSVASDARANITGGTFAEDVKDICAGGYTTQQNGEGTWDVMKDVPHVAEIDGYWYGSLSDALKAAQNGDTVKLLTDTTLDTAVSIRNQNFTLDMNGHTVTYAASGNTANQVGSISLMGSSNVTITGNGTFTFDDSYVASKKSTGRIFDVNNASVLTIENGTYHAGLTCVLADHNAEVIIKDGNFSAERPYNGTYFILNLQDGSSAKFRVFGGTFENYNPADSKTEPAGSNSDFCAPGYATEVVNNPDGTISYHAVPKPGAVFCAEIGGLKYLTVAEAVEDLRAGDTMTLLTQYTGDPITISDSVSIDLGNTGTEPAKFVPGENYQVKKEGNRLVFSPKVFTVTFVTNGGSQVASQEVLHDTAATEPTAPTRDGYTFDGWYSDEGLTQKYDFSAPVTSNITLYAKWTLMPTPVPTPENTAKPENNDNSGTAAQKPAATATPVPTAAPTAQPTATAVIPQTGDTMPVGLLGGMTAIAAAAFVALLVLRKRKSED